jgi:predicted transcriptional regulator
MEKRVRKSEMSQEIILLGKRIEVIIKEKGFKTREVAHDADMDVENLRKYIKGTQEMKVSTMLKIVEALKIEVKDLFKTQYTNLL